MITTFPRPSVGRHRAALAVAVAPALAFALVLPAGAASSAPTQAARKPLGGELSMKLSYEPSEVTAIGVIANGKLQTKLICADFREVRFRILNPPTGGPRFLPSPAYGGRDKTYSHGFLPPRQPGVYRYQAVATQERRARGLRRATCAKLTSPVRTVVVPDR